MYKRPSPSHSASDTPLIGYRSLGRRETTFCRCWLHHPSSFQTAVWVRSKSRATDRASIRIVPANPRFPPIRERRIDTEREIRLLGPYAPRRFGIVFGVDDEGRRDRSRSGESKTNLVVIGFGLSGNIGVIPIAFVRARPAARSPDGLRAPVAGYIARHRPGKGTPVGYSDELCADHLTT